MKKLRRSIPKSKMNWLEAKRKYPRLSPFGDADRDGVKNMFDCKPFNKKRQDEEIKPMKGGGFIIKIKKNKYCPKCGAEKLPDSECSCGTYSS